MKTMKRISVSTLAIACFMLMGGMTAFAQQQETAEENNITPKFGIKGGLNFSNLYVDDVKDEHLKLSGNIGFYAKLPVAKGLSIQPELLYSSKGAKLTYDNVFGSGEYRFNLNYVEVPLLLVINLTPNFSLSAGGYAAYLVNANVKRIDTDDGTVDDITDLNEENFHRFDYGLVGGASVDIENFTIGARYNYGLQNVGKSGVAGDATQNSKNSVASLFIGFAF